MKVDRAARCCFLYGRCLFQNLGAELSSAGDVRSGSRDFELNLGGLDLQGFCQLANGRWSRSAFSHLKIGHGGRCNASQLRELRLGKYGTLS